MTNLNTPWHVSAGKSHPLGDSVFIYDYTENLVCCIGRLGNKTEEIEFAAHICKCVNGYAMAQEIDDALAEAYARRGTELPHMPVDKPDANVQEPTAPKARPRNRKAREGDGNVVRIQGEVVGSTTRPHAKGK